MHAEIGTDVSGGRQRPVDLERREVPPEGFQLTHEAGREVVLALTDPRPR